MKNLSKGVLLAAALAVLAVVGHVSGFNQYVATKFNDVQVDDLKLNGNDILDSNATTRITVGATNAITGAVTVSGNLTTSGTSYFTLAVSTAPRDVSSTIGITPTATGQLVYDSTDRIVCVSTGTTRFTWVLVSTTTATGCLH